MNTITQARYLSLRSVSRRPRTPPPNHPCRLRWLQFRTRIRFTCTVCGPQDHKFNRRIFQEPGGSWIFGSDSLGNIGHNQPITLVSVIKKKKNSKCFDKSLLKWKKTGESFDRHDWKLIQQSLNHWVLEKCESFDIKLVFHHRPNLIAFESR